MNRSLLRIAAISVAVALVPACSLTRPADTASASVAPVGDFTLTLLHTNDTHSHYGGITNRWDTCYAATCEGGRGGYVRIDQAVRAIRKTAPDALFLEAGDIFQGNLFWIQHKERMPAALLDKMGYQAMTPGNHEFDDGLETWLRFVNAIKTPVLGANLSFTPRPDSLAADKLPPWIILERGGRQIGIVGLTIPRMWSSSKTDARDPQKALEAAVKELTARNVNIIIALTHLGLNQDRQLAGAVDGVDIIVGGHSHSLLSNPDSNLVMEKKPEGTYPVVEKTPNGSPVLVVTAFEAGILLGKLEAQFDSGGILKEWKGDPILLDQPTLEALGAPPPDAELAKLVNSFVAPIMEELKAEIGTIRAPGNKGMLLEGGDVRACRQAECATGNIVADALRVSAFKKAQIALFNGGTLRASLPVGAVSRGNVSTTLAFQNTPVMAKMPGSVLLKALEHSVSRYGQRGGTFLQVSGLRFTFKPSNAVGQRIVKAEVRNAKGRWQPLNPKANYHVVTLNFMANGGAGYEMFPPLQWEKADKLDSDVLSDYLKRRSPVKAGLQGRTTALE